MNWSELLMMSPSVPAPTLVSSVLIHSRRVIISLWHQAVTSQSHLQSASRVISQRVHAAVVGASVKLIGNGSLWFLNRQTLNCASSSSHAVEAAFRPNHCCPQTHLNEIRLLQADIALNYVSKQLRGSVFLWEGRGPRKTEIKKAQKIK